MVVNEGLDGARHAHGSGAAPASALCFAVFSLDRANQQLWCSGSEVALKPKAFELLRYMVEHSQRLLTKEELLDQLWGDVNVGDAVLKTHVREIRRVLGDDIKSPRYIETVHRRGYRFIAPVQVAADSAAPLARPAPHPAASPRFVGRERELAGLEAGFARALDGSLQTLFITGEPGAGKTTLVGMFLERLPQRAGVRVARGQCIEQYGAGEAYLPVLEAFDRLARGADAERVLRVLRRSAPSWLAQLPGVASEEQINLARAGGATPERMLREMAETIVALSKEQVLVFAFEDLHWADPSTLNLLSYLARRTDPARVMILGTYRPREILGKSHPLEAIQQDLETNGRCGVLAVSELSEVSVLQYLAARCSPHALPLRLAQLLRERTSGSPLFVVRLVDSWLEQGWLEQRNGVWELTADLERLAQAVPPTVSRMLQTEIERLSDFERSVLEAASVVGIEFTATAVAAVLGESTARIEETCAGWARREQLVKAIGRSEWPDHSVSLRFAFSHGLYQQVAYERNGIARAARLHQRMAEWLEGIHGSQAASIAAEIATHFEHGGNHLRAARYRGMAALQASSRCAYPEALDQLERGLGALRRVPEGTERVALELELQLFRGGALATLRGYSSLDANAAYARARELCAQLGDDVALFPEVLDGVWLMHIACSDLRTARSLAQQAFALSQRRGQSALHLQASLMLGATYFYLGRFSEARDLLEPALRLLDASPAAASAGHREDPRVLARLQLGGSLWMMGYPDQARAHGHDAVALARQLCHPFTLAVGLYTRSLMLVFRREHAAALESTAELLEIASKYELSFFVSLGNMLRGATLAAAGDPAAGVALFEAGRCTVTAGVAIVYFHTLWGATLIHAGRLDEAKAVLAQTLELAQKIDDHGYESEPHRLLGGLALRPDSGDPDPAATAERHFLRGLALARQASARSLQLRCAMPLARLWRSRGKQQQACELVSPLYASFSEGLDTPDLIEAKQLLRELGVVA